MNKPLIYRFALSCLLSGFLASFAQGEERFSLYVNDKGAIKFPADFRMNMVHLGSWFVPQGDASGFHDVYTEAGSVAYFKKHGFFPDGATLVKELRASQDGNFTTGQGVHHATPQLKQWFVMIKDSQNRFPENTLWGDGWGWALFKPGDTQTNVAQSYKADCLGCHIPAKSTDLVYTQAYPVLEE